MSKQTDKSLFITSSLPRFYQALLSGIESYKDLGNRIIGEIKTAHAFRQVEKVAELSHVLVNNPIREYQLIARYYLVWCECQKQNYQSIALEQIIDQTQTYKAQALLTRGTFEMYQSKPEPALYFYREALKTSHNIPEFVSASLAIAQLKGIEGFSESALKDLEKLSPLIKHADPRLSNSFLNSYAFELGKAGRKEEGRNIIKRVLASPLAIAYPGWHETGRELGVIECKGPRSFVSLKTDVEWKPILPIKPVAKPENKKKRGSVLSFPKLKEAPEPEQPEAVTPIELSDMTTDEKRELLMTAIRTGKLQPSQYDKMLYMVGMIKIGPASNVLDLENAALLDDMIMQWVNMIEPEELAGVMSALRDCDDATRRINLIDRIIQKAFEHSPAANTSEEEWRRKHERRLPKKPKK